MTIIEYTPDNTLATVYDIPRDAQVMNAPTGIVTLKKVI